jgi:hypothetical protein
MIQSKQVISIKVRVAYIFYKNILFQYRNTNLIAKKEKKTTLKL